jgi:predicted dehydrogenase
MNIGWGLIGCGDIARKRVAPALRDGRGSGLVAVSRAQAALAEPFAREFGASAWYAEWRELLGDARVDAVYIATPVHLHAPQTLAAAEAGKHVLCEKPMALNPGECDRMIAACRANGVKLGVAYYRHFYPAIARIKNLLASRAIGDVVLAQINAFEAFNPPPGHPRHWFVEPAKAGGGPMFDFGCHRLEVLLNILGPVRRVTSVVANVVLARDVEDTAVAALQFESGACATVTVTHAAAEPQDTLVVFGTDGSLHMPVLNAGRIRIANGADERVESHPPASNLHQPLIDDFVEAVLNDREPSVSGETGRTVADVEDRIYRAGRA